MSRDYAVLHAFDEHAINADRFAFPKAVPALANADQPGRICDEQMVVQRIRMAEVLQTLKGPDDASNRIDQISFVAPPDNDEPFPA